MSALPESIRLFALCRAMEFNHLPVAGGLYDQDPELLDQWLEIWRLQAAHDKREREREKRKSGGARGQSSRRRPR